LYFLSCDSVLLGVQYVPNNTASQLIHHCQNRKPHSTPLTLQEHSVLLAISWKFSMLHKIWIRSIQCKIWTNGMLWWRRL
jgi:hypothetical protein